MEKKHFIFFHLNFLIKREEESKNVALGKEKNFLHCFSMRIKDQTRNFSKISSPDKCSNPNFSRFLPSLK
jgi:hypothetical protein